MAAMRRGVHRELEEAANQIIRESLKGVTKHSEKADILTPWKEADRYRREQYSSSGTVDRSWRQGIYHRAYNPLRPELNSRDGIARPRTGLSSLAAFVEEHGYGEDEV